MDKFFDRQVRKFDELEAALHELSDDDAVSMCRRGLIHSEFRVRFLIRIMNNSVDGIAAIKMSDGSDSNIVDLPGLAERVIARHVAMKLRGQ